MIKSTFSSMAFVPSIRMIGHSKDFIHSSTVFSERDLTAAPIIHNLLSAQKQQTCGGSPLHYSFFFIKVKPAVLHTMYIIQTTQRQQSLRRLAA